MSNSSDEKQVVIFRIALMAAIIIVISFAAISYLFKDNDALRVALLDVHAVISNLLATLCLIYAAYNSRYNKNILIAWTVLALAQLSYSIGDIIWLIIEVGMHQSPWPSPADAFYLPFYPLFAMGILLLPRDPFTSGEKLKVVLDIGIAMIASVVLFWVLLIAPTIESNAQENAIISTLAVAYPVADLLILFALIELLFRRIRFVRLLTIMLLVASMAIWLATDFSYMHQSLDGTYVKGGLQDIGWTVCYVLNGLAGVSQANSKKFYSSSRVIKSEIVHFTWPLYIPYICAVMTYVLLIWSYDHSLPVSFSALSWAVGGMIGLIIVRQVFSLNENIRLYEAKVQENAERKRAEEQVRRLNEELETRVTERTAQLESTNKELIIEIKERKKAEEALNSARDQLLAIIEFLPDATFVVDQNKKVIAWNRAMEEMTGTHKQDILGKGDYAYSLPFYGEPRPILIDLIDKPNETIDSKYRQLVRTEKAINAESYATSLFNGKGAYLWSTASLLYDGEGQLVGSIESIRDITERKLAEEAIRKARDELELRVKERTAELEARNAEMERFTYTVSHDLRSPLVTIQGFNGFLKGDIEKGDSEKVKVDLRLIEEAVTKMDRLLRETLELSRIGRVANPPEDVPFGEIVQEALLQTAQRIKSTGMDVLVANDLPVVHVDKMRIVEAMVNFIENSIKYRGEQQHLSMEIGYRTEAKEPVFFVRDNGMGIDPSQHQKVFDLFYKVNNKSEGTGAGLAIVKRIIEVHGGRIWIESELGKGTTVCFTLPVRSNI
jgi:signal transduction histidine kinase